MRCLTGEMELSQLGRMVNFKHEGLSSLLGVKEPPSILKFSSSLVT